ncbi:MAG: ABC transporter ATP-binding protein, partial [Enterococcus faecalis]|nr:ABC transporter ATP-binding protein [Enterococcus faecalis]
MTMEKVLEVKDLRISFDTFAGKVNAIRGVSFDLYKGETLAIVGESGSGKSVTTRSIMRLLSSNANIDNGEILFKGQDIVHKTEKQMQAIRGKEIAMIFQDPMTSLDPTMPIGKQVAESLIKHNKVSKKEGLAQALELLKLVGIPNAEKRLKNYPHQFSGGQRQRIVIAIALICYPEVLIADEPTTALDVTIQAQILELLKDLQEKISTSIIFITHDLGVVANVADRVAVMYGGRLVEVGTAEEIFYNPQHPYTKGLLSCIANPEDLEKKELHPIPGSPPDLLNISEGCPFLDRCENAMNICVDHMDEYRNFSSTHCSS